MIITAREIIDIIIMTAVVGFIFSGIFERFRKPVAYEPLKHYRNFNFENFKFAAMVTAPAIILHEFGHKFVAMGFGYHAVFHAAYLWLLIGVIIRLANFGFIFFVPAFVSVGCTAIPCKIIPWQHSLIAFAGPAVNLILWLGALLIIKQNLVNKKYLPFVFLTSRINMFLFFFNMIPLRPFDGYYVFQGLLALF